MDIKDQLSTMLALREALRQRLGLAQAYLLMAEHEVGGTSIKWQDAARAMNDDMGTRGYYRGLDAIESHFDPGLIAILRCSAMPTPDAMKDPAGPVNPAIEYLKTLMAAD